MAELIIPPKAEKNWREKTLIFNNITPITKENLKRGNGNIEFINGLRDDMPQNSSEKVLNFGKHKGKTVSWIKLNDKSYYKWAVEEGVRGFV